MNGFLAVVNEWYADVVIPLYLPQTYTWHVPEHFLPLLTIGCRVEVELKKKKYAGIVQQLHQNPPQFSPKSILQVIDTEPVVHERHLQLWQWMAEYYCCTPGEIMLAALPANLKLTSETQLFFNPDNDNDFSELNEPEFQLAEALANNQNLSIKDAQKIVKKQSVFGIIKSLLAQQIIYTTEDLAVKYKEKTENVIELTSQYQDDETALENLLNGDLEKKAPKQFALVLMYLQLAQTEDAVTENILVKKANASTAIVRALVEKNIFSVQTVPISRLKFQRQAVPRTVVLTEVQQQAYQQVFEKLFAQKPILLHGVTASGKTLVYIKLLQEILNQQKQALLLLPEVALTTQTIQLLQQYLGATMHVYHHKYNSNERVEIWNKVNNGEIAVIVGTRSSVFLPFNNLGIIIVDEEHDASYKQHEPAPRYHARDVALYTAKTWQIPIVLGSATPSLESYYAALQQQYELVSLTERYNNVPLPTIEIVDAKEHHLLGEKTILTPRLKQLMEASFSMHKQVILFQNRRGYNPMQVCVSCGEIPQCQYCDVSLTYHKQKHCLSCHYCGTQYPVKKSCDACGGNQFVHRNFGTEKIEETVLDAFNGIKVARMDIDTVKGKHQHSELITQFENQKYQVLVGTQMVVKGLHFKNVNLVGIVDADALLNFSDFRVNERAFQLMEQVSGRAGRADGDGLVIVQVSKTNHPILALLQAHDFVNFYNQEIELRSAFKYPPFTKIIQVRCLHKNQQIAQAAATYIAKEFKKSLPDYTLGPSEPPIAKIRNLYQFDVLLKLPKKQSLVTWCKNYLKILETQLVQTPGYASVRVVVDVDPI